MTLEVTVELCDLNPKLPELGGQKIDLALKLLLSLGCSRLSGLVRPFTHFHGLNPVSNIQSQPRASK